MVDTQIIYWKRCVGANEKARRKLKRLLTTKVRPRHHGQQLENFTTVDNYIAYIASFLQAYPVLASEKIRGLLPLVHILLASSHSAPVIAVCQLYPGALKKSFRTRDQTRNLPLHLACKKGYDPSVLEAMVQGYPMAVRVRNSANELPVHCAIRNSTGTVAMEGIKFLVHADASCVMQRVSLFPGSNRKSNLMEFAIVHGAHLDVLTIIANHFDKNKRTFRIRAGIIDVDQAKGIALLLPTLKVFECTPGGYTVDGFILLMRSLQENMSIKKISPLSLPDLPPESPKVVSMLCEAVLQFLYRHKTVTSLEFDNIDQTGILHPASEQGDKWLRIIGTGLRANQSIQSLALYKWSVSESALDTFVSDGSAPAVFVLYDVQVEQQALVDLEAEQQNWDLCRVQSLAVRAVTHKEREYFLHTLPELAERLHTLQCVSFLSSIEPPIDATRQVAAMMSIEHLRVLHTTGVSLETDAICDALKRNQTLFGFIVQGVFDTEMSTARLLKVLERHNTSLVTFSDVDMTCPKLYDEICYWTRLNAYGRDDFRTTRAPLEQLVQFLQSAMKSPEEYSKCASLMNVSPALMKGVTQDSVNTLYGLLRECPAVWNLVHPC